MKIIGKSKDAPFGETRRLSVPGPQSQDAVCIWKCGRPVHQAVPHVVTIRRKMSTMCQNQLALSYLWRTIHSVLTQDITRPGIIKTMWTYSPIPQLGEKLFRCLPVLGIRSGIVFSKSLWALVWNVQVQLANACLHKTSNQIAYISKSVLNNRRGWRTWGGISTTRRVLGWCRG